MFTLQRELKRIFLWRRRINSDCKCCCPINASSFFGYGLMDWRS